MRTRIIVLGGGMVGMLAKFLFPQALVLDWRKPPTDVNGKPLLSIKLFGAHYLWEPLANIPCQSFTVRTTIDDAPATYETALAYKIKIGKASDMRGDWAAQFVSPTTGWSINIDAWRPQNMDVRYLSFIDEISLPDQTICLQDGTYFIYDFLISAIPLHALEPMLDRTLVTLEETFHYTPVCIKVAAIPPDARPNPDGSVIVNYISDPAVKVYRTTDRGGQRHYEWLHRKESVYDSFTLPTRTLTPGKIYPMTRSELLINKLNEYNVYPFGRYPCWRPDELLHQTYGHLLEFKKTMGL